MDYIRSEFSNSLNTRIVAMTGPLYSCKCFGGFLSATVQNIEKLMLCEVETASDIVSSLRFVRNMIVFFLCNKTLIDKVKIFIVAFFDIAIRSFHFQFAGTALSQHNY